MTDREKLIDLKTKFVEGFDCGICTPANDKCRKCLTEKEADYLLANGVIVPPCKVGDTVYAIGDKDGYQIKECKAEEFFFLDAERFQVGVCFECDTDCEGCYFNSWTQSHCGEWSCDGEYGNGFIPVDDFGKTVFLTPEEAEKALAERRLNNGHETST